MKYKEYIKLGFVRTEMSCTVEFSETGYFGFCLGKKITSNISIEVCYGELDKPCMYVKKGESETYHIIPISADVVRDLCKKNK